MMHISLLVIFTIKVPYFSVFSRKFGSNLGTCKVHCKICFNFLLYGMHA